MAPLLKELSNLEVESFNIVENAPLREGFYAPPRERSLDRLTSALGDSEVEALLTGQETFPVNNSCIDQSKCCCCCPCCCFC